MTWTLIVDFGTSSTAAATLTSGGAAEVVNFGGVPRLPSTVLATESGDLLVGAAAEQQLGLAPERGERTPKRRLGDSVMLLGSRAVRPVEAVGAILRAVADEATRQHGGEPPSELRLTHPCPRWGSERLRALGEAARLAELPSPTFVSEPVAAAIYFADARTMPGTHVAVYDLGGGTFDTAVLRRTDEGFDVVGVPGGDDRLGGEWFDDRLFEHIGARLAIRSPEAWESLRFSTERSWRKAALDLRSEVRRAKEALSDTTDYTMYLGAPVDVELTVTRDEFEDLIRPDVAATVDELEATVGRAGLSLADLAAVNIVGGASRMPLVLRLVAERIGTMPQTWGDPKAAVVLGAARAAQLTIVSRGSGSISGGKASSARSIPAEIGGHQVLAELGRGGMGVVYLARQPSLGRLVAVKALPSLDDALTARLEREAAVLGELQHPHIASVFDVGTDDRGTFIVMPYFAGGTLAHVIDRDGAVSPGQAVVVLGALAEALAATHAKGFLHRDVKPSNVLLSAEGEVYLADFGLAYPLLDPARMTNSRAVLGTAPYSAPEVLADEPPAAAADVYALGITGYQMLTGRLPFSGSNVFAVLESIRERRFEPLEDAVPDVPPVLAGLIAQAMHADAAQRPTDLRAWAVAVRAAVSPEAIVPAPPLAWQAGAQAADPGVVGAALGGGDITIGDATDGQAAAGALDVRPAGSLDHRPGAFVLGEGDKGRRSSRRAVVIAAAALIVLAGTGVALAAGGGGDGKQAASTSASTSTTTTPSSTSSLPPSTEVSVTVPGGLPAGPAGVPSGGVPTAPSGVVPAAPSNETPKTPQQPQIAPEVPAETQPPPAHNSRPVPTNGAANNDSSDLCRGGAGICDSGFYTFFLHDSAFTDSDGDRWEYHTAYDADAQHGYVTFDDSEYCTDPNGRTCIRYTPIDPDYTQCYSDWVSVTAWDPTGSQQESEKYVVLLYINC